MTACKRCAELESLLAEARAELERYREMAKPVSRQAPCPECGGSRGHQNNWGFIYFTPCTRLCETLAGQAGFCCVALLVLLLAVGAILALWPRFASGSIIPPLGGEAAPQRMGLDTELRREQQIFADVQGPPIATPDAVDKSSVSSGLSQAICVGDQSKEFQPKRRVAVASFFDLGALDCDSFNVGCPSLNRGTCSKFSFPVGFSEKAQGENGDSSTDSRYYGGCDRNDKLLFRGFSESFLGIQITIVVLIGFFFCGVAGALVFVGLEDDNRKRRILSWIFAGLCFPLGIMFYGWGFIGSPAAFLGLCQ